MRLLLTGVAIDLEADEDLLDLLLRDVHPWVVAGEERAEPAELSLSVVTGRVDIEVPDDAQPVLLHPRNPPVHGPSWCRDGQRMIYNPAHRCLIVVHGRAITVQSAGTPFDAFRVLRMLLFPLWYRLAGRHGAITLHASAARLDGTALVFTGDAGAGKTTCALAAVFGGGGELIANEYVLLSRREGPWRAEGTPEPIRLGRETEETFRDRFRGWPRPDYFNGKHQFYPRQFTSLLPVCAGAELGRLCLVRIGPWERLRVRRLEPDEAAVALAGQVMELAGYPWPTLLWKGGPESAARIRAELSALVGEVPIHSVDVPYRHLPRAEFLALVEEVIA